MPGTGLDRTIAQVLQRVGSSVGDIARVLHHDTSTTARRLNVGRATLAHSDRNRLPHSSDSTHIKPASHYSGIYPGRWNQPPVRRVENAPTLIADELERIHRAGDKSRWANYDPKLFRKGYRTLENWLKTEGPLAPLTERFGLNCWEMVAYAAARTGVLDKHRLRELLELQRRPDGTWDGAHLDMWLNRMGDWMIPEGRRVYTGAPDGPRPQRGDIVMWGRNAEHVTVATGRTGPDGSPELYSSWYLPKFPLDWDPETRSYSQVVDAVQITTVDELTKGMYALTDAHGRRYYDPSVPFEIVFGRGPW
ncbi:hypothetical protein ACIBEK_23420 [Nocardia fusca]|uniref:hypothetical protein n=1 Tax=Nocardia fusca TaxID=941183 RepID=UPI0037899100